MTRKYKISIVVPTAPDSTYKEECDNIFKIINLFEGRFLNMEAWSILETKTSAMLVFFTSQKEDLTIDLHNAWCHEVIDSYYVCHDREEQKAKEKNSNRGSSLDSFMAELEKGENDAH